MEREINVERIRAGLATARGRRSSPPALFDDAKVYAAKAVLLSGTVTAGEVARQLGCAASTLYRHLLSCRSGVAACRLPMLLPLSVITTKGWINSLVDRVV